MSVFLWKSSFFFPLFFGVVVLPPPSLPRNGSPFFFQALEEEGIDIIVSWSFFFCPGLNFFPSRNVQDDLVFSFRSRYQAKRIFSPLGEALGLLVVGHSPLLKVKFFLLPSCFQVGDGSLGQAYSPLSFPGGVRGILFLINEEEVRKALPGPLMRRRFFLSLRDDRSMPFSSSSTSLSKTGSRDHFTPGSIFFC